MPKADIAPTAHLQKGGREHTQLTSCDTAFAETTGRCAASVIATPLGHTGIAPVSGDHSIGGPRSLGMKTGQQQHRNKSEYTRRNGKIEDFGRHTFETMN